MSLLPPQNMQKLSSKKEKKNKKVLFLGYNTYETSLIKILIVKGCEVWHSAEKIDSLDNFDLVISFGYRYIIGKKIINESNALILNIHISLLPWNKGAHPNFWAFYDGTPHGVSIHLIDEGIDTGPILYQKKVNFKRNEKTFRDTHSRLLREAEHLFEEKLGSILNAEKTKLQALTKTTKGGTYHRIADLPRDFSGWDANISQEIRFLKKLNTQ